MITTALNSTPNHHKRLSLSSILPTSSTSSTIANRRRNNKNLSLCLSSDTTANKFFSEPPAKIVESKDNDINAYPNGPVNIMPFLYLGSEKNTLDFDKLKELNIGAILNVAAEVNNPFTKEEIIPSPSLSKASSVSSGTSSIKTIQSTKSDNSNMEYRKLPWEHNQDNLVVELKKAIDIIDRARSSNQTILVHCQCGVARSATVIIAYVMKTLNLPMQEAYNHVKQLAPAISPNLGLLFQLREFEQSCILEQSQEEEEEELMEVDEEPLIEVVNYQEETLIRNNTSNSRPNSWIAPNSNTTMTKKTIAALPPPPATPMNSGFLLRASSLSAWKRKLTKSTKSIFSSSSSAGTEDTHNEKFIVTNATITGDSNSSSNNNWWKSNSSRKLSIDTPPACY
jgi:protein-tyrosine phosphatase